MPLLFFTAGLFATKWAATPWKGILSGKLAFLLWPFLIWQVVVFAYKLAAALWLPGREDSLGLLLPMTLLSPLRPNGETWFLWALAIYFVITKVTYGIRARWVVGIAAIFSAVWSSLVIPQLSERHEQLMGPGLLNVLMYFVFFVGAARYSKWIIGKISAWSTLTSATIFLAWATYAVVIHVTNTTGAMFIDQILAIAGGLALARLLEGVSVLQHIGHRTLAIYLAHTTFVVAFAIVLARTEWFSVQALAIASPYFVTLASLAFGYLIDSLFAKTWLFQPPAGFLTKRRNQEA